MNRDNYIVIGLLILFGIICAIGATDAYGEFPEECKIFWQYQEAGYYIVSEIDGEHEIRFDLYILRTWCETNA